jgi:hypothetical protein
MARRRVGALLLLAALVAACSTSGSDAEPWGAQAAAWTEAFTGTEQALSVPFYDADVLVQMRTSGEGYGIQGLLAIAGREGLSADSMAPRRPPFLSRDGVVLQTLGDFDAAWVLRIGRTGIVRQSWAGSAAGARGGLPAHLVDEAVFRDLPARYLQAWRDQDVAAAASVYAPDATVVDSLRRVHLDGAADIATAVEGPGQATLQPWLTEARLDVLPSGTEDAVYVDGWLGEADPWVRLLLVLRTTITAGCEGHVAAELGLAGGTVVQEERYYRLDDVRRCLAGSLADEGWWSVTTIPQPRTATSRVVEVPGRLLTRLVGGDERSEALLLWAAGRFASAGLPPPMTATTWVASTDPGWCFTTGHRSSEDVLEVCGAGEDLCSDDGCVSWTAEARAAVLHQLGHLWVDERATVPRGCPAVSGRPAPPECADPPLDEAAERDAGVNEAVKP